VKKGESSRLAGLFKMDYVYCLCAYRPGKSSTLFSVKGVIKRNITVVAVQI